MTTPNQYEVKKRISREKLLRNGFDQYYDHFYLRKWLYEKIIYADLEINFEGKYPQLGVTVKNYALKQYYAPFYCGDVRLNNEVYNQVVEEYNKYMDSLCDNGVLWRKDRQRTLRKRG